MSQAFDPYREWLGVCSGSTLPSHYELLGLRPLEADLGKINVAYQRQSAKLAGQLDGARADVAQRLMGELAEARMTLLTPTAKRAYDETLAGRGPVPTPTTSPPVEISTAGDVDDLLPPVADPEAAITSGAPHTVGTDYPFAAVHANPAQGYPAGGYAAPQAYPLPQAYASTQMPAQWQPQAVAPPAAYPTAGYYTAPQPIPTAEAVPLPLHAEADASVLRRPTRRRTSPAPIAAGVVVVIAVVLAGVWYYHGGSKTVTMLTTPNDTANPLTQSSDRPPQAQPDTDKSRGDTTDEPQPSPERVGPHPSGSADTQVAPAESMTEKPAVKTEMAESSGEKPAMKTPDVDMTKPDPDKPQPEKTPSEKPQDSPKSTETKADAEEAAAVGKALKAVRAALADRDLSKAKDLLDEATIEATAADSLAAVNRMELLTNYVGTFWEAVRKALANLEVAETLEIDGAMLVIVEADEEHLKVRTEGRNHDYKLAKIPTKLAYFLADHALAVDDPVRNLILASFVIVEPKSDFKQVQSLLDNASAAGLDVAPLREELKAVRGGRSE
jgi:hypothetical protein